MPTLAEIRHSIIDQVSGRFPTDDSRLRFLFIEKLMSDKRALLLAEQMKGSLSLDVAWMTVVDCLDVQCGPVSCAGYVTELKEHYVMLPAIMTGRRAIQYFGTPAGQAFENVSMLSFSSGSNTLLGKAQPVYTIVDGRAIIKNIPYGLKKIRIVAILKDPHKDENGIDCLPAAENREYPIPAELVHKLELLCIKQLLSTLPIAPDDTNDGADKNQQPGRPNPYILGQQ